MLRTRVASAWPTALRKLDREANGEHRRDCGADLLVSRTNVKRLLLVQHNGVPLMWDVAPLAPRTLASYLEPHVADLGWEVAALDISGTTPVDPSVQSILAEQPDAVGFSVYCWNEATTLEVVRKLKSAQPNLQIALGGPQLDRDEEDLDQLLATLPPIDLLVRGEGELALLNWLQEGARRPLLGSRLTAGQQLPDLAELGAPIHAKFPPRSNKICVEGVRGCPYRCGFCVWGREGGGTRDQPLDAMKRELEWARDNDIRFITYAYFGLNAPGKTEARVSTIESVGFDDRTYHHSPLDYFTLTEDDVRALKRINGLWEFGVQSTYKPALRKSLRGFHRGRLEQAADWFRKHDMMFSMDVILGLPGETLESFRATLDQLLPFGMPLNIPTLKLLPGSELYTKRHELGLVYNPETFNVISTPSMTADELLACREMAEEAARATHDCDWVREVSAAIEQHETMG